MRTFVRVLSLVMALSAVCADIVVDRGETRTVAPGASLSSTRFRIGDANGVGLTSTLRVEDGGRLLGRYGMVQVGVTAGATGVVHLAGGELPALESTANVTNMSYVYVGVSGTGFFTNANGKVWLREGFHLGQNAGSFGRYVHDGGEFGFCFGGKPFAVGMLGQGELDVVRGTLSLQDFLIGGTNSVESVAIIRDGAKVSSNSRVSVGGYTNRMNNTCKEYPFGRGRLDLKGGTLSINNVNAKVSDPTLRLGWYPTAQGEVRGWGKVTCSTTVNYAFMGFGNGRVTADGEGTERTLDFTDVEGVTNIFKAASSGWYAERGGCVWLPHGDVAASANATVNARLGMSDGQSLPDLVNSVLVRVTSVDAATHVFCGGPYATNRSDVHVGALPVGSSVVGCWKIADCSSYYDWQAHPQSFKSAIVTFCYDAARIRGNDPSLVLMRWENGAWKKLVTAPPNDSHTVVSPSVGCLAGEAFNLGEFVLVEVEAFRGNVRDPITPASDGWYEIGNRSYLRSADGTTVGDSYSSSSWYVNMAYPDWDHLTLANTPKRVRFVGGTLLGTELPTGVQYDFSQVVSLTVTTNRLFSDDSTLHVPSGANFRFMPALIDCDAATGKLNRTLDTRAGMNALQTDLDLDGSMFVGDSTGNLELAGALTGDGLIRLFNYYRKLNLTGRVDFDGELCLGQVQNDVLIAPSTTNDAHVGTVRLGGTPENYAATQCIWAPSEPGGTLTIDSLIAENGSGWSASLGARYGNAITARSNGTIRVGTLTTKGSGTTRGLHLLTGASRVDVPVQMSIDTITAASRIYLNAAVDLTVGTVREASVFDCSVLGTTPNPTTFTVTGPHPADCRLTATTPTQLPLSIVGYTGIVEIASLSWRVAAVTNRAYAIPAGTVLPAQGTIALAVDGELPAPGRYQVLSWAPGCAVAHAADWSVTLSGRAGVCSFERTATGLWLVVPEVPEGVTYYVDSETGNDASDGLTPETAWRSLAKVNGADIQPGERVLFRRGGLWRGQLKPKSGRLGAPVCYGAYGEGEKPILEQSDAAEAPGSWVLVAPDVWRTVKTYPLSTCRDIGNIIFNHGEAYGWKRWSLDKLVHERDYWYDRDRGHVYLKSRLDPTTQWKSIELSIDQHVITEGGRSYVTYDGLAIRYGAAHGIGGGPVKGIVIKNCDVYWIGGGVLETKVNSDGSISYTRYGNGIEFWGESIDCLVVSNRLWEIYDAAMTDQSDVGTHTNVTWSWNTVWNAEYSYEHFNRSADHTVEDITVEHNTFVDSGGPWAHEQRPDRNGAPLMIWYSSGPVRNFTIRNNVFAGTTEQGVRQTTDWHTRVAFSNNLFWTEGAPVVRLVNQLLDFNGFKGLGWDQNSVYGDPLFRNPSARDYRLRPGSPAIGLASDGLNAGAYTDPPEVYLHYNPQSTATATNTFGRYVYVAENWRDERGVAMAPMTGAVLVVESGKGLSANPTGNAVPVSGLWYKTMAVMNQGLFHLQAGGMGITNSCSGSTSWYCALMLHGDGEAPVYLTTGSSIAFQRYVDQNDGGAATLVKRGGGTLSFQDGSNHSPAERATWKRTRLEAGEFKWCPSGASGRAYDIQTFPIGHELVFADDGTTSGGAVFSLGNRDCEWRDVALGEASTIDHPRHVVTSGTGTNVNIRFVGTPATDPLAFGGAFTARAGIVWSPDAASELLLTNAISTTTGDVRVQRGKVRLANGATFTALSSVTVADGAAFQVDASAGNGFQAGRLALSGTAKVVVGADVVLCFQQAACDGEPIANGIYTAANAAWVEGAGRVCVGTVPAARTLWDEADGVTEVEVADISVSGTPRLHKTGPGTLRFEGRKTFLSDMTVSNGVLVAQGDESLGADVGTTTFELYSKTQKGVLRVECAEGRNEVSFHRPITFHYAVDGEHGDFLYLPANATVNFYGLMQTSIAAPHSGPGYPNHWNYSCPTTCTVHWRGGMKASLNHKFPGGTHYVHKALTGGDRFSASNGAKVHLLAAGNSIGGATGGISGGARIYATVPYALDSSANGKDQTLVFSGASTLDLCCHDQALAVIASSSAEGVVYSAQPAFLRIRGNYVLNASNGGYPTTVSNKVTFAGCAGVSMERDASKAYPLVLLSRSESAGVLQVVRNSLVLARSASWLNCREAVIAGGMLTLEGSEALGEGTTVSFTETNGSHGTLNLLDGVNQKVARLYVDGEPQRPGTYGSSSSSAAHQDDGLFTGSGLLRVGRFYGSAVILR